MMPLTSPFSLVSLAQINPPKKAPKETQMTEIGVKNPTGISLEDRTAAATSKKMSESTSPKAVATSNGLACFPREDASLFVFLCVSLKINPLLHNPYQ